MFEKTLHQICSYWPSTGEHYNTFQSFNTYYAMDINGDQKSDVVEFRRTHITPSFSLNNHDNEWSVRGYANNIGYNNTQTFQQIYSSPCVPRPVLPNILPPDCNHFSQATGVVHPLVTPTRYLGQKHEIIAVNWMEDKLTYVDFPMDLEKHGRLESVQYGDPENGLQYTIEYSSLENKVTEQNIWGATHDFYSANSSLQYPYVSLLRLPNQEIVSKLTKKEGNSLLYQDFRYHSNVVHMRGQGFLGFEKVARSAWYDNPFAPRLWNVSEFEPIWRGTLKRSYTQLNNFNIFSFSNLSVPPNVVAINQNFIQNISSQNVYRSILWKQVETDFLKGVRSETLYDYDSTYLLKVNEVTSGLLKNF
jgi:hypothetical protein